MCLQVAAFEQIPIAFVTVLGSYFKGIGNPKIPFYVSFFIKDTYCLLSYFYSKIVCSYFLDYYDISVVTRKYNSLLFI